MKERPTPRTPAFRILLAIQLADRATQDLALARANVHTALADLGVDNPVVRKLDDAKRSAEVAAELLSKLASRLT